MLTVLLSRSYSLAQIVATINRKPIKLSVQQAQKVASSRINNTLMSTAERASRAPNSSSVRQMERSRFRPAQNYAMIGSALLCAMAYSIASNYQALTTPMARRIWQ